MTDMELVTMVAGLVAALRKAQPKIDGPFVWFAVFAVSVLVCFALYPGAWRDVLQHSIRIAFEAIAGVSAAGYIANKAATVVIDPLGKLPIDEGSGPRESPTRPDLKSVPPPAQ